MTPILAPLDFFAHRSGHESWQYCDYRRYLNYHHLGTGINVFPPLYFDVGTITHIGLAYLLDRAKELGNDVTACMNREIMHAGIVLALQAFWETEVYKRLKSDERSEQEVLIAGMLWAFWFRAWPTFIATFEVLMVEAASEEVVPFKLDYFKNYDGMSRPVQVNANLHVLSRPDAIVRVRASGEVVAVNWKTINSLTEERRSNITQSLQVNLEAYYAEKLYTRWLDEEWTPEMPAGLRGLALAEYLEQQIEYRKSLPGKLHTHRSFIW